MSNHHPGITTKNITFGQAKAEEAPTRKMKKRTWQYFLIDVLVVTLVFLFFVWIKPASARVYLPMFFQPFLFFLAVWVGVSFSIDKYRLYKKSSLNDVLFPIVAGNTIILAAVLALIYGFGHFGYSRLIVFGTIFTSWLAEIALAYAYFYNRKMRRDADHLAQFRKLHSIALQQRDRLVEADEVLKARVAAPVPPLNKELIVRESGEKTYFFIRRHLDTEHQRTLLVSTTTLFNIENQPHNFFTSFVNLKRVNDIKHLTRFISTVNGQLPLGGLFIGCCTTYGLVKKRFLRRYPPGLNYLFYTFYYFFKRVMPRMPHLEKIYLFTTRGRNRAISRAEILGRLCAGGFEIVDEQVVNGNMCYCARKIQEPMTGYRPTYGPLVRLRRIGRNGKVIYVYKMRTMHPYSEFLQEYVYTMNNLAEGGKFSNDFRVSTLGRYMRKLWIDELPMLLNVLRGDLKIVGVRPLSQQYYELYDDELKALRIKSRPGLIPPYYADLPSTLDEIQASEKRYLEAYFRQPFLTDLRYFRKAMYNIVVKKARSG